MRRGSALVLLLRVAGQARVAVAQAHSFCHVAARQPTREPGLRSTELRSRQPGSSLFAPGSWFARSSPGASQVSYRSAPNFPLPNTDLSDWSDWGKLVEGLRQLHRSNPPQSLSPAAVSLRKIPEGNSNLFHALHQGLAVLGFQEESGLSLRYRVTDHIDNNFKLPFLSSQYITAYASSIMAGHPPCWGGTIELNTLADIYDVRIGIYIYHPSSRQMELVADISSEKASLPHRGTVLLLYSRNSDGGDHFDALVQTEIADRVPSPAIPSETSDYGSSVALPAQKPGKEVRSLFVIQAGVAVGLLATVAARCADRHHCGRSGLLSA